MIQKVPIILIVCKYEMQPFKNETLLNSVSSSTEPPMPHRITAPVLRNGLLPSYSYLAREE